MATRKPRVCVLGCGFLGAHVVEQLLEAGEYSVCALDLRPIDATMEHWSASLQSSAITIKRAICAGELQLVQGNLCDTATVRKAISGCNAVIHTASVVDVEADWATVHAVNVLGTNTVIEACVRERVGRLVYTSSMHAVSGWDPILDGDETVPYPSQPKDYMCINYGRSKAAAEQAVIAANGRSAGAGHVLHTCACRPPAIYGEGDQHFIADHLNEGVTPVRMGDGTSLMQVAYVGNVAAVHLAALQGLSTNPEQAAGQVFFALDDEPGVNYFDLVDDFARATGQVVPRRFMSYRVAMGIAMVVHLLAVLVSPCHRMRRRITEDAVGTVCVTQTFVYDKAARVLGYKPRFTIKDARARSRAYYKQAYANRKKSGISQLWLVVAALAVLLAGAALGWRAWRS